jgi:hypothetical protein
MQTKDKKMKRTIKALMCFLFAGAVSAAPPPYPVEIDTQSTKAPKLTVNQNNDRTFRVTFKDDDVAQDITGHTASMTYSPTVHDSVYATSTTTIVSGPLGVADFYFSAAQLNTNGSAFVYEVTLVDTDTNLVTYKQGTLVIKKSPFASGGTAVTWVNLVNFNTLTETGVIDGVVVSNGVFYGDGAGLTNISGSGDTRLDNTTATNLVNMGTFDITNAGTVTATAFVGDGSGITGISGGTDTRLDNTTATNDVNMGANNISNVANTYVSTQLEIGSPSNTFSAFPLHIQGPLHPFDIENAHLPISQLTGSKYANILMNGEDSQLVMFSKDEGGHASVIILGETGASGEFVNSYSIGRAPSSSASGELHIGKFRTSTNYADAWTEAPIRISTNGITRIGGNFSLQYGLLVEGESEADTMRVKATSHGSEYTPLADYTGNVGANITIEGTDSSVEIVSTPSGNFGSKLGFIQTVSSVDPTTSNQWAFLRESTTGGDDLNLYFSTDNNPGGETPLVEFRNEGQVDVNGELIFDPSTITNLTEEATPTTGDFIMIYEATSGQLEKTNVGNLPGGGGGGSPIDSRAATSTVALAGNDITTVANATITNLTVAGTFTGSVDPDQILQDGATTFDVLTWGGSQWQASPPAWQGSSNPVVLDITTRRVGIGNGIAGLAPKLGIGGDTDEPQLVIEGHSTQTDDVLIIRNDAGTENFTVSDAGAVAMASGSLSINGVAYTFPATNGTSGQVLEENGSGTLSWATPSGGGGGTPVDARSVTATVVFAGNDITTVANATITNLTLEGTMTATNSTLSVSNISAQTTSFNTNLATHYVHIGSPSNTFTEARLNVQGPDHPFHLTASMLAPQPANAVHANVYLNGEDSQIVAFSENEGAHGTVFVLGETTAAGAFNNSWTIGRSSTVGADDGALHVGKYRSVTNWGDAWSDAAIVIPTNQFVRMPNGKLRLTAPNITDEYVVDSFYTSDSSGYLVMEGSDFLMSIISSPAGSYGSRLDLTEVVGTGDATVSNLWSFARRTTGSGGALELHYNTDGNPSAETPNVTFEDTGEVIFHDNELQSIGVATITNLTEEASPTTGDFIMGYEATSGAMRKFDIGNISGGGGGGGTVQDSNLTVTPTDVGLVAYTAALGTNSIDLQTVRTVGGSSSTAQINHGDKSSILGGENNRIAIAVTNGVVAGGNGNEISVAGNLGSIIGSGINNGIDTAADNIVIGGGDGNTVSGASNDEAVIAGGNGNSITGGGTGETISGGSNNQISGGSGSVIAGGSGNTKSASGLRDVIGGGENNLISVTGGRSVIAGGQGNTIEGPHNVIGGGQSNFIGDNTTAHSSILGGQSNVIDPLTGGHNTILGGNGCSVSAVAGISYVLLWGNDVDVLSANVTGSMGFGESIDIDHNGCFYITDDNGGVHDTQANDTFYTDFAGGHGFNTENVDSTLSVNGAITLDEMAAPGTPDANRVVIYNDSADGELKVKDENGSVVNLEDKFYTITIPSAIFTVADGTTYHVGNSDGGNKTDFDREKVYIPVAGEIYGFVVKVRVAGTLASTENVTHQVRLNGTTDVGSTLGTWDAVNGWHAQSGMATNVSAGDFVSLKVVTPTWVTDPTSTQVGGQIIIKTN